MSLVSSAITPTNSYNNPGFNPFRFSSGVLTVAGTNYDDRIHAFTVNNGSTLRVHFSNRHATRTFDAAYWRVQLLDIRGFAGNDFARNWTNKQSRLDGGWGNDTLIGGNSNDTIIGGAHNDKLYGLSGNDRIYGDGGNDRIEAGWGNDWVYGGDQDDWITGQQNNDTIYGGRGDDTLYGYTGNDKIYGNSGNDYLSGWYGNDFLSGGSDNDRIYGGYNNDRLFGDSGADYLHGGDGNDGLFGGIGWRDTLVGGDGADRVITASSKSWHREGYWKSNWHAVVGIRSYRWVERIRNEDSISVDGRYDATFQFMSGGRTWRDWEVKWIDDGFDVIHSKMGNARLLMDHGKATRVFRSNSNSVAWNTSVSGRHEITFANGTFTQADDRRTSQNERWLWAVQTTIHEIAHTWDNESPIWGSFLGASGWQANPRNRTGLVRGNFRSNGRTHFSNWWYRRNSVEFARSYGQFNPYEDFATSFAAVFMRASGLDYLNAGSSSGRFRNWLAGSSTRPWKVQIMHGWLNNLRG